MNMKNSSIGWISLWNLSQYIRCLGDASRNIFSIVFSKNIASPLHKHSWLIVSWFPRTPCYLFGLRTHDSQKYEHPVFYIFILQRYCFLLPFTYLFYNDVVSLKMCIKKLLLKYNNAYLIQVCWFTMLLSLWCASFQLIVNYVNNVVNSILYNHTTRIFAH